MTVVVKNDLKPEFRLSYMNSTSCFVFLLVCNNTTVNFYVRSINELLQDSPVLIHITTLFR